jgi:hypothetical protein
VAATALVALLTLGGDVMPAHAQTTVSVWLQTMDSCKQALGSTAFVIVDNAGTFKENITTPSSSPHTVASGSCPLPRGNCTVSTVGCVQATGLPVGDSFQIRETATPPATSGNPFGYAPCNAGSACRNQFANLTVSSTGAVAGQTTNIAPDNTSSVIPSSTSSFAGTAADPIVFHDFGLGSGSCDGDSDADDFLTGTPSSHCPYLPESGEASACQPFPWSCTLPTSSLHFALSNPGPVVAGVPFTEKITALDGQNNVSTTYTGSQSLSWFGPANSPNGTAPKYPANPVSFSKGVAQVSITLTDAQTTPLTVTQSNITGTLSHLVVGGGAAKTLVLPTPVVTAGQPFTETVTAFDAYGNVAGYSGGKTLTWSGPAPSPNGTAPAYPANPVTFTAGATTVSITLYDVQTTALSVTDGVVSGTTAAFAVAPAPAGFFAVATPPNQTAGKAFSVAISALDGYGNAATGYSGAQALSFSGPLSSPNGTAPGYPASVTFTKGAGSATMTLFDAQTTTITVAQGSLTGTSGSFTVGAAPVSTLRLATPPAQTAGVMFSDPLNAADAYGNAFAGTMCVAFSGPQKSPNSTAPAYPPQGGCALGQSSVVFSGGAATPSITLFNAKPTTLTAATGTISATTGTFSVLAGPASLFQVASPGARTAGVSFALAVTAVDTWGNVASGYPSSACLSFSGAHSSPNGTAPSYPAAGSCASGQSGVTFTAGVAAPTVTLVNAATTTLSLTDGTVSGTTGSFSVGPGAASSFGVATPGPQTAGSTFSDQITAFDAFGNLATGYAGTPSLSGPHSAPLGNAPQYGTAAFSGGVATVSITLFDAETTTLTASDGSIHGTSGAFSVGPAAASSFKLANPGTHVAGSTFSEAITALDAYGNLATGYSGTPSFSGHGNPDASPNGTAPQYTGTTFNHGIATVSVTLYDAETTQLVPTDGAVSGSSGAFAVTPGSTVGFTVGLPATSPHGTPVTANVAAVDTWGNVSTGDGNTLTVSTSDALAVPVADFPPTITLSGGRASFQITFPTDLTSLTYGTQTVTVSGMTGGGDQGRSGSGSTQVS